MNKPMSLKSLEKRAFRVTLADGLWDVLLGCFILIFALAPILSETLGDFWSSFIFLPFWGAVYLCIWFIRKHVIATRLGKVHFRRERLKRLRKLNIAIIATTVTLIIIGLAMLLIEKSPLHQNSFLSFRSIFGFSGSLLILAGFCIAALLLDYPRLFFYGMLIFIALPVGEWLYINQLASHHGFSVVFGVVAGIMVLTGLVQFAWMLKTTPAIREGD